MLKKEKKPVDPFYAVVEEITHESGGVVERKYLDKLQRLLDLAHNSEMCFVALIVCPFFNPETLSVLSFHS